MVKIVAYTADAEMLCPEHAMAAYPGCDVGDVLDREGNTVQPVFSTSMDDVTAWEAYGCSDCKFFAAVAAIPIDNEPDSDDR